MSNQTAETVNIDIVSRLRMFSPFESPLMHECADMIERLRTDRLQAQHERDCAVEKVAELRADAIETVQHWSGYVSEYFKEKHDLKGDIERLRGSDPYRPSTTADVAPSTDSTAVTSG